MSAPAAPVRRSPLLAIAALALAARSPGAAARAPAAAVTVPDGRARARVHARRTSRPPARSSPGHPTTMSFTVKLPNGKPLTTLQDRPRAPHRRAPDHRPQRPRLHHPRAPADRRRAASLHQTVTFPAPGPVPGAGRRLPGHPGRPAELPAVPQRPRRRRLPPAAAAAVQGRPDDRRLPLRRCSGDPTICTRSRPQFVHVNVTDPHGQPVTFTPWFGALAHAIFFRKGSLDYFHTHVCAPERAQLREPARAPTTDHRHARPRRASSPSACCSRSPGTWRLFLQMKLDGQILTAPFTLQVRFVIGRLVRGARVAALPVAAGARRRRRRPPTRGSARRSRSSGELQLYSLAVPTEKGGATTTKIVLTVPKGFAIDSFVPSPGWHRVLQQTGSGDNAVDPEGDVDRRPRPDRRGLAVPVPRPAGVDRDVHVQRPADLLGRLDRRTGRAPSPRRRRRRRSRPRSSLRRRRRLGADDRRPRGRRRWRWPRRVRARRRRRGRRTAAGVSARRGSRSSRWPVAGCRVALALPGAASAHAYLIKTSPAASGVLDTPPTQRRAHLRRGGRAALRDHLGHQRRRHAGDDRRRSAARRRIPTRWSSRCATDLPEGWYLDLLARDLGRRPPGPGRLHVRGRPQPRPGAAVPGAPASRPPPSPRQLLITRWVMFLA